MNSLQTDMSVFQNVRFVLVQTSRAGNVGAAARAMKTMGFSELILVQPRFLDVQYQEEAVAFASGAQDILSSARVVNSIEAALQGCHWAVAVTARLREWSPPVLTPRDLTEKMVAERMVPIAFVFGSERFGLPNDVVEQCQILVNIPANPEYSSLNLAQAVQIIAYECRIAILGKVPTHSNIGFQGAAASVEQIEGLFEHLEQALVRIDFLDPDHPKKLMSRLRRLFSRTQLEQEEVNILRGMARQILAVCKK